MMQAENFVELARAAGGRNRHDPIKEVCALVLDKMSKTRGAAGVVHFTAGDCEKILSNTNFDGQRKLRQGRAENHLRNMQSHLWRAEVSTISFARSPDGRLTLLDGQHRLAAGVMGKGLATKVNIINVQADADIRDLYILFDAPESSRSDSEILGAAEASKSLGIGKETVAYAFKAMAIIRAGLAIEKYLPANDAARQRAARVGDLFAWGEEIRLFERALRESNPDRVSRPRLYGAGSMSILLVVLRCQPKLGEEFIRTVAGNEGLKKGDPRHTLLRDFADTSRRKTDARHAMMRVALAWNAFYEGRSLQIIRYYANTTLTLKGCTIPEPVADHDA